METKVTRIKRVNLSIINKTYSIMMKFIFLRELKMALFISMFTIFTLFSQNQLSAQYVSTNGTKIVDANGDDLYFNGMNLGNWLLWEGYLMMGDFQYRTHTQFLNSMAVAFGNDMAKAKEFEHQWRMNYVTQKGIDDLKTLGFNSVRVPFHFNMFWDGSNVKDDGFQYFDRVIEFCKNNDMYVLLDMHAAPGYQNPGDHCDNVNSNASQPRETVTFWDGNNVNIAAAVWKHIADYYKNEPTIWGYDLINEPVPQPGREFELLASMITMRNAIREVDNNHIIVAEGSWWGSDMQKLDWLDPETQNQSGINYRWDDNLVYQTHHYSTDVSALDGRLEICNKLNIPMILGEYGESDMNNLRNMTDWCISNNVDYFPWSFKKMSHDKCLWTIEPNEAYEQLKSAITTGTPGPSTLYDDMITFCQNNIANGSVKELVWHQDFYDAVKMPCSVGTPTPSVSDDDITGTSIKVTWTNVSGESGYNVKCSNGQSISLDADLTSYTFSNLEDDTKYTITIAAFTDNCTGNSASIDAKTLCLGGQQPFSGNAITLPGIIEGENYDSGCDAYYDLSEGNTGGLFRNDDVDITDGENGGYAIGWIDEGEWLEYTVNVTQAGTYDLEYVVASPESTGEITFQANGITNLTMTVPNTGDWGIWETVTTKVSLNAGTQVIRLIFSGALNFDKLNIKTEGILDSIVITPAADSIYIGENIDFNAIGLDQNGNTIAISETWAATGGTIDNNGLFSSSTVGIYTVTASYNGVSGFSNIKVVEIPPCTPNIPGIFEAEEYSNMLGIQTESTSDTGGGTNVGWIDAGDWLEYSDICIETGGSYNIEVRIASQSNGGQFSIQDQNDNVLATINVPVTGGWQNWESVNETLEIASSTKTLKFVVTEGGFNINWFEFTKNTSSETIDVTGVSISPSLLSLNVGETSSLTETVNPSDATDKSVSWFSDNTSVATVSSSGLVTALSEGSANIIVTTNDGGFSASCVVTVNTDITDPTSIFIEAEDYFEMYGVQTESTSDAGGGLNVGWLDAGDWMGYSVNIPSDGLYTVEYRVASESGGGNLALEQFGGGSVYGYLAIPSTGGWQNWTTISHTVNLPAGQQNIGISIQNGGWNLNWLKITNGNLKSGTTSSNNNLFEASLDKELQIRIYPNPVSERLFIKELEKETLLRIFNIYSAKLHESYGRSIDVSNIPKGVYLLKIGDEDSFKEIKFIKN